MAAKGLFINSTEQGFTVRGVNNNFFPDNATLAYPANSVILITDESDMATFRSASNYDVLFSALIKDININGERATKDNIIETFNEAANKPSGGGGNPDAFTSVEYDGTKSLIFYNDKGDEVANVDVTPFIKDGMVEDVEISEGNLVIHFNTDSEIKDIYIPLTEIFDPNQYYTKTESDAKYATQVVVNEEIASRIEAIRGINETLQTKADKSEIPDTSDFITKEEYNPKEKAIAEALTDLNENKADKTELPDVSTLATKTELNAKANTADLATVATSGSYNDLSDKPVIPDITNLATKSEVDAAKAYYISFATIATTGITDADWDGIVAAIDAHRPIYAGYPKNDGGILYYGVECMNKNGNNTQIILTSSDDSAHYFYTFTKNGSNDYTFTSETKPYVTDAEKTAWNAKQDALVSGTNIKTINNQSILGEGNIEIQGGGGEQQQADWNQSDTTAVDYIKNKPTIPAAQVNADWNASSGVAQILNKPTIPTVPTNVSAFTNDAGYLTQHQSLADYYTKTEIDAMIGNINTILASI